MVITFLIRNIISHFLEKQIFSDKKTEPLFPPKNWMKMAPFCLFDGIVFLALADTFGEQELDLPVDGAKVVLGPCRYLIVERGRKSQGNLFLRFFLVFRGFSQNATLLY